MVQSALNHRMGLIMCIAAFMGLVSGAGMGIGSYTFIYAKGLSYMGNAPETCANCHVMREYLDAWVKSSHKHVAVCNDCHTPITSS